MSESERSSANEPLRTVTPYYRGRPNREMNLIGFVYFLVLLVLLVPLLPVVVVAWVLSRIYGAVRQRAA
jgi:hypothetical protein